MRTPLFVLFFVFITVCGFSQTMDSGNVPFLLDEAPASGFSASGTLAAGSDTASISFSPLPLPIPQGPVASRLMRLSGSPSSAGGPQNIATLAAATASDFWGELYYYYGYPYLPNPACGNDSNSNTSWIGHFGVSNHWYRLDWPAPVSINKIVVSHEGFVAQGYGGYTQTVSSIQYFNASQGVWLTIPGTSRSYDFRAEFTFSAVQA
ncbi:MAG: hypothetical protein WA705_00995, partial [Candidatus Ozemobacteraceae bacterium]